MTVEELARRIDEYSREVFPYEYEDEEFDGRDMIAETIEALETEPEHMLKIFKDEADTWNEHGGGYERRLHKEASEVCNEIEKLVKKGSSMLVEIYPNNKSGRKYSDEYFKWVKNYDECMEWYKEGDGLMVFLDTETNVEAIYRRFGGVLCLDDRFSIYSNVDMDEAGIIGDHNVAIQKMLIQEAIDAGFPEETPQMKRTYVVDIDAVVRYTFQVDAGSLNEASKIASRLIKSERFYDNHVKDNWDTSLIDMDNIGIVQVMEDDFGYETIDPAEYIK